MSEAKTLALSELDVAKILRSYFLGFTQRKARLRTTANLPATVQLRKWYSSSVASDLMWLCQNAKMTRDADARALKLFCFSAILMKATRETRHWGYICDNTEPRDHPHRDVSQLLEQTIEEIRLAYRERDQFVESTTRFAPTVVLGDAQRANKFVSEGSVDLIVTSPPYFGVVDYVKAQRLSLEWFEHEIEYYRTQEIGARSKRHRKNAIIEFESELKAAFEASCTALRPGRLCAVIFGASEARSFRESRLIHILETAGLEFVYEVNRDISIQRRQKPSVLSECVYIFRKPFIDSTGKGVD